MIKIQALLANPHTRYAALAYVVCKYGLQIMEIWFQSYSQNLRATADIIEGAAIFYGLTAAGAGNPPLKEVDADLKAKKVDEIKP